MSIDRYELSGSIDKKRSSLSGDVPASRVITGASAYEIAKANGFVGTEEAWLESLKGRPGDPGEPGNDYILTEDDKKEIAELASIMVEVPESGGNVDLEGYATEQWVKDQKYLTAVPDGYAKIEDIPKKPEDIGAQPSGNYALKSEIPAVPVQSVNGKTGAVELSASDVGARHSTWIPTAQEVGALPSTYTPPNQTAEQVGADPKGTAAGKVSDHNTNTDAHNDIRLELKAISDRLTAFFDSDDKTLDELSEIVAYITSNKALIDSITTSKVNVADIINNLTTNVSNKPLSAAQGVVLKGLIDTVSNSLSGYQPKGDYALKSEVPTKVSQLTNDKGYLTEHQSLEGYAKTSEIPKKPEDIGAQPAGNYALKTEIPKVPANVSAFNNDAGYLTEISKTEIVQQVIAALPVYNGEVV